MSDTEEEKSPLIVDPISTSEQDYFFQSQRQPNDIQYPQYGIGHDDDDEVMLQDPFTIEPNLHSDAYDMRDREINLAEHESDALESGLESPQPGAGCWSAEKFGMGLRIIAGVLFFCLVLAGNVFSKLSFLSLAEAVRSRESSETHDARPAYLALVICITFPMFWDLLWRILEALTRTKNNNPWPTHKGFILSFFSGLLEGAGVSIFVLMVATRCSSSVNVLLLMCVFSAQSIENLSNLVRNLCSGVEDLAIQDSIEDDDDEQNQCGNTCSKNSFVTKCFRVLKNIISSLLQLACLVAIAFLPYTDLMKDMGHDNDHWFGIVAAVSLIAISASWMPWVHRHSQKEAQEGAIFFGFKQQHYPSNVSRVFNSARTMSSLFTSIFRVVFAIATIALVTSFDKTAEQDFYEVNVWHELGRKSNSAILQPLITQLVSSFVAYHSARYACMLGFQIWAFCIPLYLVSICSLLLIWFGEEFIPFHLYPGHETFSTKQQLGLFVICLVAWLSQIMITLGSTWNNASARLALDEALFWQPSYSGIFLEQFTIVNRKRRRYTIHNDSAKPTAQELKRSCIYICTTMYREDEREMIQLLKSVLSVDKEMGTGVCHEIESHVFMDDGSSGDIIRPYAKQFLRCLCQVAAEQYRNDLEDKRIEDSDKRTKIWMSNSFMKSFKTIKTPYGARIELVLPNGMKMVFHLKDKSKVKNKKRWSQVLYLYYFLQYRCRFQAGPDGLRGTSRQYILATDADVKFEPKDVKALLMLLARDASVGAVCARTFPLGSGLMYWYQVFDYAVGHWFQKAAEHVLGTVLCCPGCFSMYRINALRNVTREYASEVSMATEFLTKDMGEDRWLCTLLVLAGWRLDYCAAAEDYTYCPEDFDTFYKQRRRWTSSTLANIVELLSKGWIAARMNDSVSYIYLFYQALMLFSTAVCPATVLLVMSGGMGSVTSWSGDVINAVLWTITLGYVLVCLYGPQSLQLNLAKLLTALFAMLMAIVAVGLAIQVADDQRPDKTTTTTTTPAPTKNTTKGLFWGDNGSSEHFNERSAGSELIDSDTWYVFRRAVDQVLDSATEMLEDPNIEGFSISSFYLLSLIGIFLVAAILHLKEFPAIFHGIWYLLGLPAGYLLLIIYSFCNLDDVSWGTRVADSSSAGGADARNAWYHRLLFGCGLGRKETYLHFFGRTVCCRRNANSRDEELPYLEEKKESKPKSILPDGVFFVERHGHEKTELHITSLEELDKIVSKTLVMHTEQHSTLPIEMSLSNVVRSSTGPVDDEYDDNEPLDAYSMLDERPPSLEEFAVLVRRVVGDADGFGIALENEGIWSVERAYFAGNFEVSLDSMNRIHQIIGNFRKDYCFNALPSFDKMRQDLHDNRNDTEGSWLVLDEFLRKHNLPMALCLEPLRDGGYDDTSFLVDLDDKFLSNSKIVNTVQGLNIKQKLLNATRGLRPFSLPDNKPDSLDAWLRSLHLIQYKRHFEWFGFDNSNMSSLRSFKDVDFRKMGIDKHAHVSRFAKAVKTIDYERPDDESINEREHISELVEAFVNQHQYELEGKEHDFWKKVIAKRLNPALKIIKDENELKDKLRSLKMQTVGAIVLINILWLVLMIELTEEAAKALHVAGTNPLGLLFLATYGCIFAIQFITMLVHRLYTMMQIVASADAKKTRNNRYSEAGQEMFEIPSGRGSVNITAEMLDP